MNIIDCSHFQGSIQWDEVADQLPKIDGVYIKASQGVGYVDAAMKYNASEAHKAGLKVGYYHYATLNTPNAALDAKQEARYFIDTIGKAVKPDLPLVLDIEENKANLSAMDVWTWITTFFNELEEMGFKDYALYSYTPFLNASLPNNHKLGHIKLWLAAYVNKVTPILPHGWDSWWLWQYSAHGRVNGVSKFVDVNKTL